MKIVYEFKINSNQYELAEYAKNKKYCLCRNQRPLFIIFQDEVTISGQRKNMYYAMNINKEDQEVYERSVQFLEGREA